ncbi:hypothetical protein BH10BAC5_BH10BAC5_27090 [soil metagenome]
MKKNPTSHSEFSDSTLIQHLKVLSNDDIKGLTKFVHTGLHNNRRDVTHFFDVTVKFYPTFKNKNFSRENIFKVLYPGKKYQDDILRRLSSNLLKIAEEYASYSVYKNDRFEYELHLLNFYASKNIDKLFWKQHAKIINYLEEQPLRDPQYYYKLGLLDEIELRYMLKDDPTYKRSSYEKQMNNLAKYTLSSMLRVYGFAEYEKYFFNKTYELKFKEQLISMSENSEFISSQTVEIYYLLLKLYDDNSSDDILYRVKALIEKISHSFTKAECFSFYIHIFNYCNINKLKKDKDYTVLKFEVVCKIVEKELVIHNGMIDPGWFRGIFFMAFEAGEIQFAENFIEKYRNIIAGKDSEHVVNHAYANIAYHKKDYEAALTYLSNASYQHINDKWIIKEMQLKIYYEINNYDGFSYVADSIKHLIKEEGSWNENLIIPIRSFVNFSTRLFKMKLGGSKGRLDELKKDISEAKIIRRKWLMEKVEELEKIQK